MRVGFVLGSDGFAAVLYERELGDAARRSPWYRNLDDTMSAGLRWAEGLGVPVDIVQVDRALLGTNTEAD